MRLFVHEERNSMFARVVLGLSTNGLGRDFYSHVAGPKARYAREGR